MGDKSGIKRLRESRGLSQQYMADVLGMSRPSYDKVEMGTKDLTVVEAQKLSEELGTSFDIIFMNSEPSIDYDKGRYKEMICRFIKYAGADGDGRIPKTKLAKLLYLLDFSWYYDNLDSVSGLQYRRIAQGPVPDEFFRVIDEMYDTEEIDIKVRGKAMMISLNEELDPINNNLLSEAQDKRLREIAAQWKTANTQTIVDYTHSQLPWRYCGPSELIPYDAIIQEDPDHVYQRPISSTV